MKTNKKNPIELTTTFEGAKVKKTDNFTQLKRSVLTTFLWEDNAYESGEKVADRIVSLIPKVKPELVSQLAIAARSKYNLRHVPLLIVREMARHDSHKHLVSSTLNEVIQRPDELGEFLSLYWKDGRTPISNQIKKGLAKAFTKFNAFQLQKYNQDNAIKLKDVLFLSHAKPVDKAQAKVWKQLIDNTLPTPNTWETRLSASGGKGKKEIWEELLSENQLGAMALLKNLRNFSELGVDRNLIVKALRNANVERVLPFRFISAAKYYPSLEGELEQLMFKCLEGKEQLKGTTALIIDTSPSMWGTKISAKSEMDRFEAAAALAILLREVCQKVNVYAFNNKGYRVAPRRGFALRDVLAATKDGYSAGALALRMAKEDGYDRLICLTDGQWHSVNTDGSINSYGGMKDAIEHRPDSDKSYLLNVANYTNGVGYEKGWTNLNGFSECVVDFILELENEGLGY